jgi:RHS repeat-associated protein
MQADNLTTLPGGTYAGDTGTYNDASELTSVAASGGTVSATYDADGNRLSWTQGSTTLASGAWNGADELTSYSVHGGSVGALSVVPPSEPDMSSASYDGNGLREADTVGSTTHEFVWDTSGEGSAPRLLEDGSSLYIYGPNGTPVEQIGLSGGTRKYLVPDALGSVRAVLNSSGSVLGTASYDSYGTPSGTGVSSNTFFGFAGGYTDSTGLVYLLNRYYNPATGQFLSVDPLVNETGRRIRTPVTNR